MADLDDTKAAQTIKIVGASSDGTELSPIGSINDSLKVISSSAALAEDGKLFSVARIINCTDSDEDNPLLFLKNPTSSTKRFFIWRVRVGSTVTNTSLLVKLFVNPTITTNGTSITPLNRIINGTTPASVSEIYTLPTVSSPGTLLTAAVVGQNTISIDLNESFSIILSPNSSLLITGKPSSNNRSAAISLVWREDT